MKNKFNIKIFMLSLLIALGACTDNFEEINTNPNEPTNVPTPFLLSSAQKQMMDFLWDEWFNGRVGMLLAQYWAQNEYTDESRYLLRENVTNNYWLFFYAGRDAVVTGASNGGGLQDLQEIIRLNTESPEQYSIYGAIDNQIAVARIMKVWMFQILTDIWGDVPYFEALNGQEVLSPAYSPQSEIYPDLLRELTEASNQIDTEASGFASGDLIYNGDMTKWKKFANSLKLRVAIRMADVDPSTASSAISEALAAGVFESNEDNAIFNYMASVPNNNPLNEYRKTRADFAVSNVLIDQLKKFNDPRIMYYADPNANGEYVGLTYGLTQAQAGAIQNEEVSQPDEDVVFGATSPGIYMDFAETLFIRAEAAQRGFTAENPADLYNQAITTSINFWAAIAGEAAVDNAMIQDYYTNQAPYDPANWKQSIGVQKWLSLYMQGLQGWIEWRRLDFGILQPPAAGPLVGNGIPVRLPYPTEEANLNESNYKEAVSRQGLGAGQLNTKVWWDVN